MLSLRLFAADWLLSSDDPIIGQHMSRIEIDDFWPECILSRRKTPFGAEA